jgi:hypothetical protein
MESYDIFLINVEEDDDGAFALKDLIENYVVKHPTVCMANDCSFITIRSIAAHSEACIKYSKYVFYYVTKAFLENQSYCSDFSCSTRKYC